MLARKAFAIIFCKYFHSPLKTLVIFHFLHLIVTVKENKPAQSAQAVNTVMYSGCLVFYDPSCDQRFCVSAAICVPLFPNTAAKSAS